MLYFLDFHLWWNWNTFVWMLIYYFSLTSPSVQRVLVEVNVQALLSKSSLTSNPELDRKRQTVSDVQFTALLLKNHFIIL